MPFSRRQETLLIIGGLIACVVLMCGIAQAQAPAVTLNVLNPPNSTGNVVLVRGQVVEVEFTINDPTGLSNGDRLQLVRVDDGTVVDSRRRRNRTTGTVNFLTVRSIALTSLRVIYVSNQTGAEIASAPQPVRVVADLSVLQLEERVAVLEALVATLQANLTALTGVVQGNMTDIGALAALVSTLQSEVDNLPDLTAIQTLTALAPFVRVDLNPLPNGMTGPHVLFEGANVHIRSGSGVTDDNVTSGGTLTGRGNLVVGYDETSPFGDPVCSLGVLQTEEECVANSGTWALEHKSGSHNLIVGAGHRYSRHSGVVFGSRNTINGRHATVVGGSNNIAGNESATVSGGVGNTADGSGASVSGGFFNTASGPGASVSGGNSNKASGVQASVSGGENNEASTSRATVSGGSRNRASGRFASVSGGEDNEASGGFASVSGGVLNFAPGEYSTVSGGEQNLASGFGATVSGGLLNTAQGDYGTASGGSSNSANSTAEHVP